MATFCVTGSAGHLGEALVRTLSEQGHRVVGLDVRTSPSTTITASITDRDAVRRALAGVDHVLHTATLHKPHVGSHTRQDFVDTNITGTLTVLELAAAAGVRSVVFTSSTSAFGRALTPGPGQAAVWVTEDVTPKVRNVYGATTPFTRDDLSDLATDAAAVITRRFPEISADYACWGWTLPPTLDRVYDNALAHRDLGWQPRYDFPAVVELVRTTGDPRSPLARAIGAKGYHAEPTGVYTR
jgi:nucleoside-diphosphate-sugar epimerase